VIDQPYRTESGGLIDRDRPLTFRFDGREYTGYQGDTLASALLANGVRLLGRSFKYHRPRGVMTAGAAEPNALVELRAGARRTPNVRATVAELYDGLEASSQNRWPSLAFDAMSVNGLLSPFLPAGFYYKTFMWPRKFWEAVYEPLIRRSAGLGRASGRNDPDRYERAHLHCDVLVAGGGPAGLAAALAAGRAGARVVVCDEGPRLGGSLLSERVTIGERDGAAWADATLAELARLDNVRVMPRTTVFGYYDHNVLGAIELVGEHLPEPAPHTPRERLWKIEAERVVIAAGAHERPIAFPGNDLPGIMLASAARAYANRYGVRPGERAVVFGNNDDIHATTRDLAAAGVEIAGIVDSRTQGGAEADAPTFRNAVVREARGGRRLKGVVLDGGQRLACDLLCVAGGWNPAVHLSSQTGPKPVWDATLHAFVPGPPKQAEVSVGAAAGRFTTEQALKDGAEAGRAAAAACGHKAEAVELPAAGDPPNGGLSPLWYVPGKEKQAFVDPQNDVTVADVKLAAREGYASVEHMKRYTTLGMATDQGKVSNIVGLAILAEARNRPIPEVGTTTFRPPYTPVSAAAFAGYSRQRTFQPVRRTPLHDWAEARGAVFVEAGPWLRVRAFPREGEGVIQAAYREAEATRDGLGLTDVSTLGKIDIQGPDAAEFLNRLYINGWKKLPVGKARYGLMLREDGIVLDDGTTSRLGEQHYLMTTTTGNAGRVMAHVEFCHQVLWPELDVTYVSVTDQWAGLAVAGPTARELMRRVFPDEDLSNEAFPFLGARELALHGVPARLFRITFSGELGFELNVPADFGHAAAELLMEEGADLGVTPYGLEALDVMRIEKGHVTGGELDGRTTAGDLGFARMMSTKKDYIGRRLSQRPGLTRPDRPRLVGLVPVDRSARLRAGAHLLPEGAAATIENDQGHVTSVTYSPRLGHYIGLAMLSGGADRKGERIRAVDLLRDSDVVCEVVAHIFFDPEGERQRG